MCMEDVRLGRKKYNAVRQLSIPAGAEFSLLGKALNRTHITIHCVNNGLRLAPQPFDTVGLGILFVDSSRPPLELDVETHGDVVTQAWNASGNGGTSAVLIIETFLQER